MLIGNKIFPKTTTIALTKVVVGIGNIFNVHPVRAHLDWQSTNKMQGTITWGLVKFCCTVIMNALGSSVTPFNKRWLKRLQGLIKTLVQTTL
ncbi:hypothetical protein CY35_02G001700 [Sphagnum magellanicum]|nr:hypothetical protein CY35_02G001700 [Sphagnum magellanicum]